MTRKSKSVVVALGGNALISPGERGGLAEQLQNVDNAMKHVAKLVKQGWNLVLTHGNGPQVGDILLQQEISKKSVPEMPLYVCVAESQGQIGYMIQESLYNHLHKIGVDKPIITLVTQVIVDRKDKAFRNPTKPIGPFYPKKSSMRKGWRFTKEAEGFRRVVASPDPVRIVEADAIRKVKDDAIIIACGGGGVPVVNSKKNKGLIGIDAVIDKDLSAELLANVVKAEMLIILTDVDNVALNYDKPSQRNLRRVDLQELKKYHKDGHFAPGTMEPKIEAAIRFLERGNGPRNRKVLITSFDLLDQALEGRAGTIIER
jgi:carbamate kinase